VPGSTSTHSLSPAPSAQSPHHLTLSPSYLAALASSLYGLRASTERGTGLSSLTRTGSTDSAAEILAALTSGASPGPTPLGAYLHPSHGGSPLAVSRPVLRHSPLGGIRSSMCGPGSSRLLMHQADTQEEPLPVGPAPGPAPQRRRTRSVTFQLEDLGTAAGQPHEHLISRGVQPPELLLDSAQPPGTAVLPTSTFQHVTQRALGIRVVQPHTVSSVTGDVASSRARTARRVSFGALLQTSQVGTPATICNHS
jgi:hypothetical protein